MKKRTPLESFKRMILFDCDIRLFYADEKFNSDIHIPIISVDQQQREQDNIVLYRNQEGKISVRERIKKLKRDNNKFAHPLTVIAVYGKENTEEQRNYPLITFWHDCPNRYWVLILSQDDGCRTLYIQRSELKEYFPGCYRDIGVAQ